MNHAKHQEDVREGLDSPTFPMWAVDAVWECPGDASLWDTALPAYVVSMYHVRCSWQSKTKQASPAAAGCSPFVPHSALI